MNKLKILILLLLPLTVQSQQLLTLQMAVDSALQHNFDIRIARNVVKINDLNNNLGEAGALPYVNISGSSNNEISNNYQKTTTGTETTTDNEESGSLNTGISAGITLFNGFKVYATKEKLNLLEEQSKIFLEQQIQNTMAAVMIKYYDIIRQENYMRIVISSLDFARKELEIVEQRRSVGLANEANVLQAQIDLNLIDQTVKSQELTINQAKTELLELLGVTTYFPFTIKDTIQTDSTLNLAATLSGLNRNLQLTSRQQQVRINEQIVKEVGALRFPSIHINTAYNFSLLNNPSSTLKTSQSYGPSAGLTVQIPIFNGLVYRNQREVAKYNVVNARLEQDNIMNSLTATAVKTHRSYTTLLEQLRDQQENYTMSGKLLSLTLKRFQVNQATILDMKAAQESYEKSGYLLVNLQFAAKMAEIDLKLLTFSLGK